MKDAYIMAEENWRTVQLFINEEGISEVEVNPLEKEEIRCSCSKSSMIKKCAHIAYVKKVMDANEGHYTLSIPVEIDEEVAIKAAENAKTFRDFILKYGKVEVL